MAGKGAREISVFVDESGSFDPDAKSSQFYLICMVFHDQDVSIAENVAALNVGLREIGLAEDHAVHAGPLIRWESPYRNLRRQDRRVVFAKMLAFLRRTAEKEFFLSIQNLKKNFLQPTARKRHE